MVERGFGGSGGGGGQDVAAVEALLDFADEIRQMVPQDAEPGTALRLTE